MSQCIMGKSKRRAEWSAVRASQSGASAQIEEGQRRQNPRRKQHDRGHCCSAIVGKSKCALKDAMQPTEQQTGAKKKHDEPGDEYESFNPLHLAHTSLKLWLGMHGDLRPNAQAQRPGHQNLDLQPDRDGRVRCSAWLGVRVIVVSV